jgi:hypothetical protein
MRALKNNLLPKLSQLHGLFSLLHIVCPRIPMHDFWCHDHVIRKSEESLALIEMHTLPYSPLSPQTVVAYIVFTRPST